MADEDSSDESTEKSPIVSQPSSSTKETKENYSPKLKNTLFITKAGLRLKLSEVAIAAALQYYHLFHINMDTTPYNNHLVAMATLYLASKSQDSSVRLSDLVNTCYYCIHGERRLLDVGETYWQLKESVARMELVLLRALRFKFQMDLPHKYLIHHLYALSQWVEPQQWQSSHVIKLSWSLLQDTFHTQLNLVHAPNKMAVTVLYLAVQITGLVIPSQGAQRQWWQVMCPGIKESDLQSLSEFIMESYENSDNIIEVEPPPVKSKYYRQFMTFSDYYNL